jgi:hypothetical protein
MIAGAMAVATLFGGLLPGQGTTRFVLRTYIQPPVELKELASPLVGFRKYSSATMKDGYNTQGLLKVSGAPKGSLLRIAVLDDYTGHSWSASGDTGSRGGFQRLGSRIPAGVAAGQPVDLTLTFLPAWDKIRELSPWIPSLGYDTAISFTGANQRTHQGTLRYNLGTGQAILTEGDRLHDGDTVSVSTVPVVQSLDQGMLPAGESPVDPSSFAFLSTIGQKWAGDATSADQRIQQIASTLKAGKWSDGTVTGETQYAPGHGQGRLLNFAQGQPLVGSDEQYAATFALLCNQAGFPTRVVFGAIIPDGGEVKGADITAWVEVETDKDWRAVRPETFTPSRDNHPPQVPQAAAKDEHATYVPPPNPSQLSSGFDQLSDGDLAGTRTQGGWLANLGRWAFLALMYAGPPIGIVALVIGGILTAKAMRRHRRRVRGTPGDRVAAGWKEILDQATDLGVQAPPAGTRLEQSRVIAHPAVTNLAVAANTAIFGIEDPVETDSQAFWTQVKTARRDLLGGVNRRRRLAGRLSPRSLLPARLAAVRLPKLQRPERSKGRRQAVPDVEPG